MAFERVPISASVRFSVFKRDGFACQYCGAHPPSVVLECDHIIPVVEGGSNDITNLATACFPCNRGKGAVPLSVVPQSLAEKAAETAEREAQLRGYADVMEARRVRLEDDAWRIMAVLYPGQDSVPRASFNDARRFIERLGVHAVLEAAEIAAGRAFSAPARVFRYFCGVCWNKIREGESGA